MIQCYWGKHQMIRWYASINPERSEKPHGGHRMIRCQWLWSEARKATALWPTYSFGDGQWWGTKSVGDPSPASVQRLAEVETTDWFGGTPPISTGSVYSTQNVAMSLQQLVSLVGAIYTPCPGHLRGAWALWRYWLVFYTFFSAQSTKVLKRRLVQLA
jgi:hypothetical protein